MPSTVVFSFSYNLKTNTLKIVFVNGLIYDYKHVPEKIYQEMKESFSKGVYFNRRIKGKYSFERVNS